MSESSRSINHKLNELLSKNNINKAKLDEPTALSYATILKTNILGKDKQEKVNSIVVLAKLLDCIIGSDAISDDFIHILDHTLFQTLFSIVSANMSSETYKAILKILVIDISGAIFRNKDDLIDRYLPLFESLIEYLDLVTDLINKSLKFEYSGIITLAGRLKHVTFFSTVGNLLETDDKTILEAIENLKVAYFKLNQYLQKTQFDLSIKSHQTMLNNLFIYLETSLNEYGTPATTEEYIRAGFTDNPRQFVIENFTILLAMDLKIFLKDPNFTFKKRFHEELMMSDHTRTFPLYQFISKCTDLWIDIFHKKDEFPMIYSSVLSWDLMVYYTMNNGLILWQETRAQLDNRVDIAKIFQLLYCNIEEIEKSGKRIDEAIVSEGGAVGDVRHFQITKIEESLKEKWSGRLFEFNKELDKEVREFVREQRILKLMEGCLVTLSSTAQDQGAGHEIEDVKVVNVGSASSGEKKSLISINTSLYKINLLGRDKVLFSCFSDSGTTFDGLTMMLGKGTASQETLRQIETLIEIRSKTQLLDLNEIDDSDDDEDGDDEEELLYDLLTLLKRNSITSSVY
ncbi:hypothetical protein Cantr_02215 [Candida viswanathii]|uniref:Uncharacterized protein n=1 Tax=Candida viswanathii TaxID=5486 RepID=A0A367YKS3_9ASCO|nr:hypothetical protein Cantr_02215 [Candida viswanathii]